jgi:hypothetical protein
LKPTTPQAAAGIRIEPPISEPLASVVEPAASDAAEPPEEPPTASSGLCGLRVTPWIREWVKPAHENSGAVERACTIAPASR